MAFSLTAITRQFEAGSDATIDGSSSFGHCQFHTSASALGFPATIPSIMVRLISATISPVLQSLHRGHASRLPFEAQFVRFSLIVIVNMPPSPGTPANTWCNESRTHLRTSGELVHMANCTPSGDPLNPDLPAPAEKNSPGIARGSFM
jgi:hypothetical protein